MNHSDKIYVAGHRGMVGSAIVRALKSSGYSNLVTADSNRLDLRNQIAVANFFKSEKPDYVFLAAAKVGGIMANSTFRADFLYDNLNIQTNVIHQAFKNSAKKLLFLGSSCIYPRLAPQPLKETYLLSGYLEPTNEPYAIAKIAGIKLCEAYHDQYGANFISAMPTNLYGFNDNYHSINSHVLPALVARIHKAKINKDRQVVVWGSGKPLREFMFADEMARACLHLMRSYNDREFINIGTGEEVTVAGLAGLIAEIIGYQGTIEFDKSKPDGTPRKALNIDKLTQIGFHNSVSLKQGIELAYKDYLTHSYHEA